MESYLDVPTIDQRTRISDQTIQELTRRIVDRFHPDKIILFGSYAYGAPKPESDVDILVVMDTHIKEIQQALEIRQAINPLFGLDIIVYSPDKLKKRISLGDSFLKEIVERGIVLYESSDA